MKKQLIINRNIQNNSQAQSMSSTCTCEVCTCETCNCGTTCNCGS